MTAEPPWRTTFVDGVRVEWLPLLSIGATGRSIGVSRAGQWLAGDDDECFTVASEPMGVCVLAVLEEAPEATVQSVSELVARHSLEVGDGVDRPFLVAVEVALSGTSDYWAELALGWLAVVRPSTKVLALLEAMIVTKWASQRVRHLAATIVRREKART